MDSFKEIIGNADKLFSLIKVYAIKGSKETTQILLELYYVMVSDSTSKTDKFLIGVALAYQTVPKDLLPTSKLGLLGFIDNAAALMFAYKKIKCAVTPEISLKVKSTMQLWFPDIETDEIDFEQID